MSAHWLRMPDFRRRRSQSFEWKASADYGAIICPVKTCLFSGAHGKATLADGPTENTTTVSIASRVAPGKCCPCCGGPSCCCMKAVSGALKGLSAAAPKRFKDGLYLGPETMER